MSPFRRAARKSRHTRKASYQRTRRAFFEQLERRDLLASLPVAVNDPIYNTALNTQFNSSTAVIANDFEVDSHSITASVVANPSNGTLNSFNTSTGQFTYTPNTNFTGIDTFTYKTNNGTNDSNVATVSIAVGGVFGPRTNLDDQPLDSPMYTGANTVVQNLSLGDQLIYRSDTVSLKPVIVVETSLKSGASIPNSIDAVLTFNGTSQGTVNYTNSGLAAGDTLRFALQADATSLATGYYAWSMTITANYTGSTSSTTLSGYQAVVNRTGSEYGKGWWLNGLDQLVTSGSGALLVRGNGDTLWFQDNSGTYAKAAGDTLFSTLVKNGNNTYTLTDKHGMVENFGTTGLLTSRVDPNGNTLAYAYTDGDSDSVNDELYTITDPYSRVRQTLAYSSTRVSTFTDMASHATTLAYTSGQLTSVTLTDPDGAGALAAPVWAYAYNGTTGLLQTQTDPNSEDTGFTYNSTSLRLSGVSYPIGSTTLTPVQTYGLKTGSSNALVETVNPFGVFVDERSNEFRFQMDRFGNVLSFGYFSSGSSNDVTDTYRDPSGLPYKILQPAIGGTRYQTLLGYNALGDLLKIYNPDTTTQTFTYDTTFHNVLTATDEMARVTTFTYDAYGNELTRADNVGNTWTTSYSGRSDGLPTSITSPDPDGAGPLSAYVTSFSYDSYGQLTTTTFPDSSTQVLAYNSAGMVTSVTDELGNVTAYAYDALNRATSITGADPDGAGALSAPVTSLTWDAASNLLTQTDALGNVTSLEYDGRNRLVTKTLPDPDGAGGNVAPEVTYAYDAAGNLTSEGYVVFGSAIVHTYDPYGRRLSTTQGVSGKSDVWTYDVLGRMTSYTSSLHNPGVLDQMETWEYDSRGQVTKHSLHDPDGSGPGTRPYETFTYNHVGQPATHTDFLGNTTSYDYTTAGWLNSITLPDPDGSGPLYSPIYTFGYDFLGNRTGVSNPNNHTSTKTWDSRGRLASETGADPDGAGGLSAPTTSYGYDDHGNLTSITNALGNVTYIGYDDLHRRISLTLPDPDGAGALSAPIYAYGYSAVNSLTTETDPLGNVTTTAYDNLQRKISVTLPDPDGAGGLASPVWNYAYGSNSLLATMTDPMGHDTDYGYDTFGRQTTVTNHDGHVTTTAYNLLDQVTSVTTPDPDGAGGVTASVTAYAYDYLNRLASSTDALSGVTAFTYDLMGRLINLRDPVNNDTAWSYDNAGRVTMETNELNDTRSFYHDAGGNLTRKLDRNERVTQYTFDNLDRMTSELWIASGDPVPTMGINTTTQGGPINEVQRVGFSISGMLMGGTFTLSFGGNTTSGIAYNASAATVQSALEGLASIGSGNVTVTKTTDTSTAKEWTLTFQGSLGGANQSQVTINNSGLSYFGGKTDVQATDTNGSSADEVQVVTLSNATDGTFRLAFAGQTTAPIAYDASSGAVDSALEALTSVGSGNVSVSGSSGGAWTVTFNGGTLAGANVPQLQGDAAAAQSGSVSHTISYTYDTASQLTAAGDSDGELDFGYDYIGRVTSETQIVDGLTPHVVLATTYDAASNRTELAATLGSNADFKNSYLYDNLNRMTRVTQQSNGGNTLATKRVDFAYNALGQFGQIDRYQNTGGTNLVATTAFTYDTLYRLSTLNHDQGGTTLNHYSYAYDYMDRLTSVTSTAEGTSDYSYDKTSQLNGADHDTSGPPDESYSYDANGNRTGGGYSTTTNNLTTSDGTYDYEYDDEGNRTKKTTISTGGYEVYTWDHRNRLTNVTFYDSGDDVLKTVDEHYDILNRWTHRQTDPDGPGGASATDTFFAYDGIEPIYQFEGNADTDLIDRYLWGPTVDQILADEQVTSLSSGGNTIWTFTDYQGTVRDLGDQNESTYTTIITNHRTYNVAGLRIAQTNSSIRCYIGYSAKITDDDTQLENHVNRWYDAALEQWASEDPDGFGGRDTNLRRAGANSLVNFGDPIGKASWGYGPFRSTPNGLGFSIVIYGNYGGKIATIELSTEEVYGFGEKAKERAAAALGEAFAKRYHGYRTGPNLGTIKLEGWPESGKNEHIEAWIVGILSRVDASYRVQKFFADHPNAIYGRPPVEGEPSATNGEPTQTGSLPIFPSSGLQLSPSSSSVGRLTANGILSQPNTGEPGKTLSPAFDGTGEKSDTMLPLTKYKGNISDSAHGNFNRNNNARLDKGNAVAGGIQKMADMLELHNNQFTSARIHAWGFNGKYYYAVETEDGKILSSGSYSTIGTTYIGGEEVAKQWSKW